MSGFLMIQNQRRCRLLAQERACRDAAFIADVLRRYNLSKSKTLNFEEVRTWLKVLASAQAAPLNQNRARNELGNQFPGASTGLEVLLHCSELRIGQSEKNQEEDSIEVSDDEVEWIFMIVMDKKQEGSYQRLVEERGAAAVRDLELPPSDFEYALRAWRSYIINKPTLEVVRIHDFHLSPAP